MTIGMPLIMLCFKLLLLLKFPIISLQQKSSPSNESKLLVRQPRSVGVYACGIYIFYEFLHIICHHKSTSSHSCIQLVSYVTVEISFC